MSPSRIILCLGDSITHGSDKGSLPWPVRLGLALDETHAGAYAVVNGGVGGYTVSQIQTRWNAIKGYHASRVNRRTLVVLGGVNDTLADTPAATTYATLKAIYDDAGAAGWDVIALACTPAGSYTGWSGGKQTILDALNTSILGYAPTSYSFTKIDTYSLLEDVTTADQMAYLGGTKPDCVTATYPGASAGYRDFLHPNDAGMRAIALAVFNAMGV